MAEEALDVSVEQILQRYPQLAGFIDHPELGQLLRDAAANGWGAEELQGALHKTDWYQTSWADFRRVEVLKSTDPAEYAKQFEQAAYEVKSLMGQLGIDISQNAGLVPFITQRYLEHGKDDWFLFSQVGEILMQDLGLVANTGQLAVKKQELKEFAADMLLDYDDKVFTKHAVNTWRRVDTDESIKERMRQDAIKRYEHLGDGLKRGLSVRELVSPLVNQVARTLEISPEEIDLTSPKFRELYDYVDTDSGQRRMMTVSEAERFARRQESFQYTKTARDEAHEMAMKLMEQMGAIEL